jgi:hypothetical protein
VKYCLFLLFFAPLCQYSFAQLNIGIEGGFPFDRVYLITKNENILTKPFLYSPMCGFTINRELSKNLALESGIYRRNYGHSFQVPDFPITGRISSNSFNSWQFLFRTKPGITFKKKKIKINALLGLSYCINTSYGGSSWSASNLKIRSDSVSMFIEADYSLRQTFILLETGASFEFPIFRNYLLSITATNFTGFRKVANGEVGYNYNNVVIHTSRFYSKGDYFAFIVGLKIPINRKIRLPNNEEKDRSG